MDNPVAVCFGDIYIYWHGIILVLAIAAAVLCAAFLRRAQCGSMNDILLTALFGTVPALALGRAFYCYFAQNSFSDKSKMLSIGYGGFALYGAVAGYLLTLFVYCAVRKCKLLRILDAAAPGAAIGICIGRMSSYFTNDDVGRAVSNPKLQHMPFAVFSVSRGEWSLAVFVFEAITAAVIFFAAILIFALHRSKNIVVRKGDVFLLSAFLYGVTQTVFESMRSDSLFLISLGFVRISQVLSIIIAAAIFVVYSIRSAKRGITWMHWAGWSVSVACIALAFWMEFCMTNATVVRNYTIMCLCLAFFMFTGLSFYLDSSFPHTHDKAH